MNPRYDFVMTLTMRPIGNPHGNPHYETVYTWGVETHPFPTPYGLFELKLANEIRIASVNVESLGDRLYYDAHKLEQP